MENDSNKFIGSKIRQIRIEKGLSQKDVQKATGITQKSLSEIETGKTLILAIGLSLISVGCAKGASSASDPEAFKYGQDSLFIAWEGTSQESFLDLSNLSFGHQTVNFNGCLCKLHINGATTYGTAEIYSCVPQRGGACFGRIENSFEFSLVNSELKVCLRNSGCIDYRPSSQHFPSNRLNCEPGNLNSDCVYPAPDNYRTTYKVDYYACEFQSNLPSHQNLLPVLDGASVKCVESHLLLPHAKGNYALFGAEYFKWFPVQTGPNCETQVISNNQLLKVCM